MNKYLIAALVALLLPVANARGQSQENTTTRDQSPICKSALKKYFADPSQSAAIAKYVDLQAQLTLNRLAWAYLKNASFNSNGEIASFQETILKILKSIQDNPDPKFQEARKNFSKNRLSRNDLNTLMPYVSEILHHQKDLQGTENEPYLIHNSDLSLLSFMAENEAVASNGKHDDRMLSSDKTSKKSLSLINFAKLINSSYIVSGTIKNKKDLAANLQRVGREISRVNAELEKLLSQFKTPSECAPETLQGLCKLSDDKNQSFQNLIKDCGVVNHALLDGYQGISTEDHFKNLKYGEQWLKVVKSAEKKTTESAAYDQGLGKAQPTPGTREIKLSTFRFNRESSIQPPPETLAPPKPSIGNEEYEASVKEYEARKKDRHYRQLRTSVALNDLKLRVPFVAGIYWGGNFSEKVKISPNCTVVFRYTNPLWRGNETNNEIVAIYKEGSPSKKAPIRYMDNKGSAKTLHNIFMDPGLPDRVLADVCGDRGV